MTANQSVPSLPRLPSPSKLTPKPDDNVNTGAKVLMMNLHNAGGNVLRAFGGYNGWFTAGRKDLNNGHGLTEAYPCSPEGKKNGDPQNLNYLQQMLNGWLLGKDVYGKDNWIGTYRMFFYLLRRRQWRRRGGGQGEYMGSGS